MVFDQGMVMGPGGPGMLVPGLMMPGAGGAMPPVIMAPMNMVLGHMGAGGRGGGRGEVQMRGAGRRWVTGSRVWQWAWSAGASMGVPVGRPTLMHLRWVSPRSMPLPPPFIPRRQPRREGRRRPWRFQWRPHLHGPRVWRQARGPSSEPGVLRPRRPEEQPGRARLW